MDDNKEKDINIPDVENNLNPNEYVPEEKINEEIESGLSAKEDEAVEQAIEIKDEAEGSVSEAAEEVSEEAAEETEAAEEAFEDAAPDNVDDILKEAAAPVAAAVFEVSGPKADAPKKAAAPQAKAAPAPQKAKTDSKQGAQKTGLAAKFREVKSEFHKIIWPNRKELSKMTLTVIITSLMFGILIAGMDAVFGYVVQFLVKAI